MNRKTSLSLLLIALGGLLIWLLLRNKSLHGKEVTSKIGDFFPTQLGAPRTVIEKLSVQQLQNDVAYWIDPSSGMLLQNRPGLVNGSLPLVALTNSNQIAEWYVANAQAVNDLDLATYSSSISG